MFKELGRNVLDSVNGTTTLLCNPECLSMREGNVFVGVSCAFYPNEFLATGFAMHRLCK